MDAYNGTGYASVGVGEEMKLRGKCTDEDPVEAQSDANAAAAGATSTPATAVAMSCRSRKVSLYYNEAQTRLLGCSKPLR